jgi:hypothetical protein
MVIRETEKISVTSAKARNGGSARTTASFTVSSHSTFFTRLPRSEQFEERENQCHIVVGRAFVCDCRPGGLRRCVLQRSPDSARSLQHRRRIEEPCATEQNEKTVFRENSLRGVLNSYAHCHDKLHKLREM